ncbi:MAG TPA: hypothetical protein ENO30_01500 [Thermodesulfobium narugense]|uniref:Glycosyltransferase involved in cell wall bisynthesis n=1 Tax=Thermodesulfobium acidiphilum TaxID=1794699 RepID=A0A2R4VYH2_THEAF|nr:glycosyltransferase [Thermodesulfobium acidiphilum]AWB09542.1 Glycosyltransferase involved in cell wall bisynthesis [Thermodesulfobium acidiphilum]PMP85914.1 MAG: hypothetical protein C0174_03000 [Thermodesulfobium narugense]HEM55418.1 hypothetical protein [Thermodesulfobium narugense]
MIKILGVVSDHTGCPYYRMKLPSKFVERYFSKSVEFNITDEMNEKLMREHDFIIVQKTPYPERLEEFRYIKKLRKKLMLEFDDFYHDVPSFNPSRNYWLNRYKYYRKRPLDFFEDMLGEVDKVIVSTKFLKNFYEKFNKNIVINPNNLDPDIFLKVKPARQTGIDNINICWFGSSSHVGDFDIVGEVLKEIVLKYDNVYIHIGGDLQTFLNLKVDETRKIFHHWLPFDVYPFQYSNFQIAVAPILDLPFNRARSPLKYYEYGCSNLAGVYDRLDPYELEVEDGRCGILVKGEKEWFDAICKLIEDEELRYSIANNAREDVLKNHIWSEEKAKFYLTDVIGIDEEDILHPKKVFQKAECSVKKEGIFSIFYFFYPVDEALIENEIKILEEFTKDFNAELNILRMPERIQNAYSFIEKNIKGEHFAIVTPIFLPYESDFNVFKNLIEELEENDLDIISPTLVDMTGKILSCGIAFKEMDVLKGPVAPGYFLVESSLSFPDEKIQIMSALPFKFLVGRKSFIDKVKDMETANYENNEYAFIESLLKARKVLWAGVSKRCKVTYAFSEKISEQLHAYRIGLERDDQKKLFSRVEILPDFYIHTKWYAPNEWDIRIYKYGLTNKDRVLEMSSFERGKSILSPYFRNDLESDFLSVCVLKEEGFNLEELYKTLRWQQFPAFQVVEFADSKSFLERILSMKERYFVITHKDARLHPWFMSYVYGIAKECSPQLITTDYILDNEPICTPDLSVEFLESYNYVGKTFVVEKELLIDVLRERISDMPDLDVLLEELLEFDSQRIENGITKKLEKIYPDFYYDILLRISEKNPKTFRIPMHLIRTSESKDSNAERIALENHLERIGFEYERIEENYGCFRIYPKIAEVPIEVFVVGENVHEDVLDSISKDFKVTRVSNFRQLFNAAKESNSENVLVIKDSLRYIDNDVILGLNSYLSKKDVGITSLKALYSQNKLVIGTGIVISKNRVFYAMNLSNADEEGLTKRGSVTSNFISPIIEIFAIKRHLFLELGSISDTPFSQLELSLKALEMGKRTVVLPYFTAMFEEPITSNNKFESSKKKTSLVSKELSRILTRYKKFIISDADLYFNPMLNYSFSDFEY